MVTRLVKIFEDLKNNRQYFMLSSLRGSVGFPGCLKRPFKVSELEYSGIFHENSCTGASLWTMHFLIRWNPSLLLFLLFLYYTLRIQILCFSFRFFIYSMSLMLDVSFPLQGSGHRHSLSFKWWLLCWNVRWYIVVSLEAISIFS